MSFKKVSFDFDGTLGHKKEIQEYCKELLKSPETIQVHITTRRYGPEIAKLSIDEQPNSDWWKMVGSANWEEVYSLVDQLGIARENIKFCNMTNKSDYLDSSFIWHLDDDMLEIEDINLYDKTRGIWIGEDWLNECKKLLN